ncbi:MAG: hypothetical protein ABF649_19275 [Bacillus sp. (in: firmicutes)]
MYRKKSDINFTTFKGQKVKKVKSEVGLPLGIFFEKAILVIECPWRLVHSNQITVGFSDCKQPSISSYKILEKQTKGKKITDIHHFENISDLIIELEHQVFLELFHDSTNFEGWQLQGDEGFLLVSLPGGGYEKF